MSQPVTHSSPALLLPHGRYKKSHFIRLKRAERAPTRKFWACWGRNHNQPASNLVPVLQTPSWIVLLVGQSR